MAPVLASTWTSLSSAAEICRKILEDVHGFSCETEPCDDITLVVVKRSDLELL